MAARGLSARVASTAALAISVLLAVLVLWYYRLYVRPPMVGGLRPLRRAAVAVVAVRAVGAGHGGGVVGGRPDP